MINTEPDSTLSWVAYHLFNSHFYNRWKAKELNYDEKVMLISITILHCKMMLKSRNFFQMIRFYDKKRVNIFTEMLINLMENNYKDWLEANIYKTMPELRDNDISIQHLKLT